MRTKQSTRCLAALLLTLFVVIGGAYALGGADVYRGLKARVRSWTEPPTPREMQAAAAFAAAKAVQDSIERVPTNAPKGVERPVSLRYAVGLIAVAVIFVVILLVASTLWPRLDTHRETARG